MKSDLKTSGAPVLARKRKIHPVAYLALGASIVVLAACGKKTPQDKLLEIINFRNSRMDYEVKNRGEMFLQEHPDTPEADQVRYFLAEYYIGHKQFKDAYEHLDAVCERNDINTPIGFQAFNDRIRVMLENEKNTTDAIKMAEAQLVEMDAATTKTEFHSQMRDRLAYYNLRAENYGRARELLLGLIVESKELREIANFSTGVALSWVGEDQPDQAVAVIDQFLDRHPDCEDVLGEQPMIAMCEAVAARLSEPGREDYASAIQVYKTYLNRKPNTELRRKFLTGIAYYHSVAGQEAEAEKAYAEAINLLDQKIEELENKEFTMEDLMGPTQADEASTASAATPVADDAPTTAPDPREKMWLAYAKEQSVARVVLEKSRLYELRKNNLAALRVGREYLEKNTTSSLFMEFFGAVYNVYENRYEENLEISPDIEKEIQAIMKLSEEFLIKNLNSKSFPTILGNILTVYARQGDFEAYEALTNSLLEKYPETLAAKAAKEAKDRLPGMKIRKRQFDEMMKMKAEQATSNTATLPDDTAATATLITTATAAQ